MSIIENCPLAGMNTFGMDVRADRLAEFSSTDELRDILRRVSAPLLVIGCGSNLLFTSHFSGTILRSSIGSIEITAETAEHAEVRVGSGVVWDDFVIWCVENGLWGVENLSAIPGQVGAGAVQNTGAYGVEAGDVIRSVEAVRLSDGRARTFSSGECRYSYRQSIF